ncbi:MAG: AAA family ATPase [Rickettsiales bacterium]|jgi:DNA polymerase-3 subunit delta'|nr:AAA family ATPase [Rickettsiales bacterium]
MAKKKEENIIETIHPMRRSDLLGQAAAEKLFLDAWKNRDARPLHPVWILAGPKGVGKATLAHRIARFVLSGGAGATLEIPAHEAAFQRYIDGGYADLAIVSLETDPEEKSEISVDFARRMTESLRMSASDDSWRVVVIDSIDDMNRNAANSLLKILEEPPAKTLFLIVAHRLASVLPTIKSRAQVVRCGVLNESDVRKILIESAGMDADMEKLGRAAAASDGSVAKALSVLGAGDDFPDMFAIAGMVSAPETKASKLVEISKQLAAGEESMSMLLDVVHYLSRATPSLARLYSEAAAELASADALNLDPDATAFKIIRDIRKCLSIPTAI